MKVRKMWFVGGSWIISINISHTKPAVGSVSKKKKRWPKSEKDFTKYLESETHPVYHPEGTERFLLGCKTACAWSWQSTSVYCRCQGCRDPPLHAPKRFHSSVLNYAQRQPSVFN